MAAPLGFKTFTTGEVLTAADTNGYLMQGVLVFADAAARTAAITSPQEGQTSYLKDTDVIQVYSGSAWVTKSGSSPLTTKGDLYTYSTTDARLAVGANDTVLMADSTAATGIKWGTISAGSNWSLLNAGGTALTGATTVTVSGISAKDKIAVAITGASAAASATISVRFNGDTGANYNFGCEPYFGSTVSAGTYVTAYDRIVMADLSNNAASTLSGFLIISGANASGLKIGHKAAAGNAGGGTGQTGNVSFVNYAGTSTISSVSVVSSSGNLDAGTVFIYTSV